MAKRINQKKDFPWPPKPPKLLYPEYERGFNNLKASVRGIVANAQTAWQKLTGGGGGKSKKMGGRPKPQSSGKPKYKMSYQYRRGGR